MKQLNMLRRPVFSFNVFKHKTFNEYCKTNPTPPPLIDPLFVMATTKEAFDVAVKEVQTAEAWSKAITTDRKLLCYAFYKQALVGDVKGDQPWAVQFEARSKYDAWAKIEGTTAEDAMKGYVKEWEQQKIDFNKPS
jgi:diazepam-binding inhibitor (GABA receptor modulator, acyl-CoA-binding protein)